MGESSLKRQTRAVGVSSLAALARVPDSGTPFTDMVAKLPGLFVFIVLV